MFFITHCLDKPGALETRLAHYDEHRAYLANPPVHLVVSGPLVADDGETMIGSLFLTEADSKADVEAFNRTGDEAHLIMLPRDPDASSRTIRSRVRELTNRDVAVIINDSFGRLDRLGSMGMAIGFSGISAVEKRKQTDLFGGYITPVIALVDELSAAASMLMGQGNEGIPVVIVRGDPYTTCEESGIRDLLHQS